jgi:hypothetical protein
MTNRSSSANAALIVASVLLAVYVGTGASALTFWDAGEFATAFASFGIPHPPGTPLYVSIGAALWHALPVLSPVRSGTLLSALATSAACAVAASVVTRVSGKLHAGVIAGLCAGAMGTVWINATETEVYSVSLLCAVLQMAFAYRAFAHDDDRARVVVAYLAALSLPLHLSALVAAPAAFLLANTNRDGSVRWSALARTALLVLATIAVSRAQIGIALALLAGAALPRWHTSDMDRWCLAAVALTPIAWSAVCIMLVRAQHNPFLNQGDPSTMQRLLDVISRAQYDVAPLWPRRAPLWLQLSNLAQYADWQVALGLWNDVTVSWWRTPFSVVALTLGVIGVATHWRVHRPTARALVALALLGSIGVCLQLNLNAGPSIGIGILPDSAAHEARERDYFFALAFWCWGLWIGIGTCALMRNVRQPMLIAALVPVAMFALSWRAVSHDSMPDRAIPSAMAAEFLQHVPRNGLLLTAGDNDTYPLWYRQVTDSRRRDVIVVVTSLLPTEWYFRQSTARLGLAAPTADVGRGSVLGRAGALARAHLDRRGAVAVSIAMRADDRNEIGRVAGVTCWRRAGLIDIASRGESCPPRIDLERSFESATRLSSIVSPAVRVTPDGALPAFQSLARCPAQSVSAGTRGATPPDSAARELLDITCNLR